MPHAASPRHAGMTDSAFHRQTCSPAMQPDVTSSAFETSPAARWASIRAIDHKHPVVHHRWTCGFVTTSSSNIKAQPNASLSRIRRMRASVMVSSAWPIGWGNADRAGLVFQMIRRRRRFGSLSPSRAIAAPAKSLPLDRDCPDRSHCREVHQPDRAAVGRSEGPRQRLLPMLGSQVRQVVRRCTSRHWTHWTHSASSPLCLMALRGEGMRRAAHAIWTSMRVTQLWSQMSDRSEDRSRGSGPPILADLARRTTRLVRTGVRRPAVASEDAAYRPRCADNNAMASIRAPVPMLIMTDDSSMLRSPSRRDSGSRPNSVRTQVQSPVASATHDPASTASPRTSHD